MKRAPSFLSVFGLECEPSYDTYAQQERKVQ